jgi:hypothetical protein
MKIAHAVIGTTKVSDKVLLRKDVPANQREVILGLSHEFIQMGQPGFNV